MIIKSNKDGMLGVGSLILRPGSNLLNEEGEAAYEACKGTKEFKKLLDDETLEIVGGKKNFGDDADEDAPDEDGGGDADALKSMPPKKAVDLVQSTTDEQLLLSWQEGEKRKTVKEAIVAQLKKVREPAEYRDGEKADQESQEDDAE